jgi:hypothetical protein
MIGEWLTAIEASKLSTALRHSAWAYPLVNAGHILGVALLVGGILPLDLRLIGLWRRMPLFPLWRVLTRTAGLGLILAVGFGTLLFITRATAYVQSSIFLVKMGAVAAGAGNAIALHWILSAGRWRGGPKSDLAPPGIRIMGGLSMAVWLTAMILGRLVGYF